MVEIRGLLRRHDHVVPRLGGGDPALFAAPAHHRGARGETAFEDLVPSDEAATALGQPGIEMPDEPALELILVLEAFRLHARLRRGSLPPLGLWAFVAADVDELRRKEREHLVEDVLEETQHVIANTQDVIGDAPVREYLDGLSGVAELGIRRDRGDRVSGHLDLRDHGDAAIGGVPHDLPHVVLRVEAPMRLARELPERRILRSRRGHRVLAPGADLGEPRVLLDLDAPALVLGEVPVEDVDLVQRKEIEMLEHELLRHEVATDIQVTSAPAESRTILDLDARDGPRDAALRCAPEDRRREQLPQCRAAVPEARGARRADADLFWRHCEAIPLVAELRERRVDRE